MLENFRPVRAKTEKLDTMPADLAAFSDDMLKDQYYPLVLKLKRWVKTFGESHKKSELLQMV
jgi:hypothetical protein